MTAHSLAADLSSYRFLPHRASCHWVTARPETEVNSTPGCRSEYQRVLLGETALIGNGVLRRWHEIRRARRNHGLSRGGPERTEGGHRGESREARTYVDDGGERSPGVEDGGNKCEDLPPFTGVASAGGWHETRDGRDS